MLSVVPSTCSALAPASAAQTESQMNERPLRHHTIDDGHEAAAGLCEAAQRAPQAVLESSFGLEAEL